MMGVGGVLIASVGSWVLLCVSIILLFLLVGWGLLASVAGVFDGVVELLLRSVELLERFHCGRREYDDAIALDADGFVFSEDESAGVRDVANANFGISQ